MTQFKDTVKKIDEKFEDTVKKIDKNFSQTKTKGVKDMKMPNILK
jgi:hypothetical protein